MSFLFFLSFAFCLILSGLIWEKQSFSSLLGHFYRKIFFKKMLFPGKKEKTRIKSTVS
ncbi:hypothetical protein BBD26_0992 [Lactobacillus delbrueckii subsp. bulgaricus]|nr:hypothetical protein BBD26_0992 [Lactobacillus delbrueckii subsp. bulgaricus]